jgi:SAM-dependent methyltransferase
MPRVTVQPGYDELASAYDKAFPTGYSCAVERHAVAIFADELVATGLAGPVLDIGCGAGHVAHDLSVSGLDVVGLDPSRAMLALAQQRYPGLRLVQGDATLSSLPDGLRPWVGIMARFSLIHVDPESVPRILDIWVKRLQPGARVMVAFQCSEDPEPPVREFDHKVARAWRWHPDALAAVLSSAGLSERWRVVTQPDDTHRFSECHLVHELVG